ncbi:RidA family protein [Leptolyngbyaceae cyanobacterium CCMR0082]|uniref:RidA family protein n=1 Tax=Adonisia turfae CCMR0082 TaxID=2304604 RepID=A0A6M0SE93_9CYAN|nr:RidA family protein [Adonisia turfae]NEZ66809.1 RidA family protein [Adonisia turfae CCMR0082]
MSKKLINPEELYDGAAFGMSQATVETDLGLVFVSGQVDWNHQFETTETSIEGQMKKALGNLKIALTAAGSSIEQLLQVRVYIRGELGEHMETVAPILSDFLGESRPSVTGIGVASLASSSTLVEVEAIASVR